MAKLRQLEQIRYKLKRMKTLDRKISSLEEQLKRMKTEKEMLYTEYSEFIATSNVDSAVRLLEENEKNFKNTKQLGEIKVSPVRREVK